MGTQYQLMTLKSLGYQKIWEQEYHLFGLQNYQQMKLPFTLYLYMHLTG